MIYTFGPVYVCILVVADLYNGLPGGDGRD